MKKLNHSTQTSLKSHTTESEFSLFHPRNIRRKIGKKGTYIYTMQEAKTIVTITSTTILFLFVITINISNVSARLPDEKIIVITNNHTNYLSVRCFSFDNDGDDVKHLHAMDSFNITVKIRKFFSTSTMYNCSTNMGTFVAFKYNYGCATHSGPCEWRFDENFTYHYSPKRKQWVVYEYYPNYESLTRGGVIKGYYVN
ncbi:hypothetical protein P3S68_021178 [Capsicum galapagoense]